ncbi:hypothetical protein FHR32_005039 [Streptosporangium album]|uniref:Uncharacterized protein n=1 Tax=Streptosporangium album TaxID=47479 RepID=A0A7W7WAQ0_9ACTN|nr:hypothetical protein [Streptosporangium album]MBB4940662.1 hypothetical protein [Streptosporangium album]
MHVPPSPVNPGEPEVLTGPAGGPNPRRKNRRNGPAIAVFSVLAAALLGGGALFAVTNGGGDDPGTAQVPQPPESAQGASQDPGSGESTEKSGKQKPDRQPDVASGQKDTSGGDPGTATGTGSDASAGKAAKSGSGGSGTGSPAADKPAKEQQSSPQQSDDGQVDPRSDGPPGYVAPMGAGG